MEQSGKRKQKIDEIMEIEIPAGMQSVTDTEMHAGMQLNMGMEMTSQTEQTMEIIPIMRG